MSLEKNIADLIKKRGIQLTVMSRATGISYGALYDTFFNDKKERQIRGKELIAVSNFLGINPMDFASTPDREGVG